VSEWRDFSKFLVNKMLCCVTEINILSDKFAIRRLSLIAIMPFSL
jgi:hypothetical protein